MNAMGLSHVPSFRKTHLKPALEKGLIERTIPENPNHPAQKYRLTEKRAGSPKALLYAATGLAIAADAVALVFIATAVGAAKFVGASYTEGDKSSIDIKSGGIYWRYRASKRSLFAHVYI